jgi:tetratricopeptide (TPR) repeat protein
VTRGISRVERSEGVVARILQAAITVKIIGVLLVGLLVTAPYTALSQRVDEAVKLLSRSADLRDAGRYSEAEALVKRSLPMLEKNLGPNDPFVATALNFFAQLCEAQGRYADAEPLYKRSLAIREKVLGPEHPDVGTSLNDLAGLYKAQGRHAHA